MSIGFNFPVSIKPFLQVPDPLFTDLNSPIKNFVFEEAVSNHTYLDDNIYLVAVEMQFFMIKNKIFIFLNHSRQKND